MGSFQVLRCMKWEKCVRDAAEAIGGNAASRLWYEIPIPDLGGFSPRELVWRDRAAEVFEYLATLEVHMPAPTPNWGASSR
jgi:hypothetical protein